MYLVELNVQHHWYQLLVLYFEGIKFLIEQCQLVVYCHKGQLIGLKGQLQKDNYLTYLFVLYFWSNSNFYILSLSDIDRHEGFPLVLRIGITNELTLLFLWALMYHLCFQANLLEDSHRFACQRMVTIVYPYSLEYFLARSFRCCSLITILIIFTVFNAFQAADSFFIN